MESKVRSPWFRSQSSFRTIQCRAMEKLSKKFLVARYASTTTITNAKSYISHHCDVPWNQSIDSAISVILNSIAVLSPNPSLIYSIFLNKHIMRPNHRHYIEYHCRCVQCIHMYGNTTKMCCAFDDAVKLKYINLNDIIQFNDFVMHIKREIDSSFLLRVLHFIL